MEKKLNENKSYQNLYFNSEHHIDEFNNYDEGDINNEIEKVEEKEKIEKLKSENIENKLNVEIEVKNEDKTEEKTGEKNENKVVEKKENNKKTNIIKMEILQDYGNSNDYPIQFKGIINNEKNTAIQQWAHVYYIYYFFLHLKNFII